MQNLWLFIGLFLVAALVWVWWPFFSSKNSSQAATTRTEENRQAYWERKKELEDEYAQNKISESVYEARLEELSIATLQELKTESSDSQSNKTNSLSWWWPISIMAIILGISVMTYSSVGYTPSKEELAKKQQQEAQKSQLANEISQLETSVKQESSNSQNWFSLGYLYIESGDYTKAIDAFEKVQSLIGEHAEILGGKAQAMYYQEGEALTPKVQAVVDKALSLDPIDPATNILLGMHNYREGEFALATKYWQRVMRSSRDDINKSALLQSIRASQQQAGINTSDYRVSVTVALDEKFSAKTELSDTVFIYARAPEQKMPLAIYRTTVSELPISIELDDQLSMSPIASLSNVDQVIVQAVVSKAGQAGMQLGDLYTQSDVIETLGNNAVSLKIDKQFSNTPQSFRSAISVEIKVAAHILAQVSDEDTIFVFAAPSQGAKIPLVAEKLKVSELPREIILQNSPEQDDLIAQAKVVDIHALITKPEQKGFASGTPRGMLQKVEVNTDPNQGDVTRVVITIDDIVGEG